MKIVQLVIDRDNEDTTGLIYAVDSEGRMWRANLSNHVLGYKWHLMNMPEREKEPNR